MNNINNTNNLDYLALFGTFLGVLNYTENLKQTSNDELMEELKREINLKLDTLIKQNNEIKRRLDENGL